jgi:hypothetical protein
MKIAERCAALSPSMRRVVALLVVPLLLVLACLAALRPMHQAWQAQQLWREETKQLLSDAAVAPALRDALQRQIEVVRASQLRSKLYPSSGAMGAAALLQGDIDSVMNAVQASSRTLAPIPVSEESSLLRYGVRVTASLRVNQLQDVFNRLAQHQRLLRVEQLSVVAPQVQQADENPPLAVSMDIYGYVLAAEASAVPSATVAANGGEQP